MATKRSSLGKNLDVLLGQIQTIQTVAEEKPPLEGFIRLPVEYLSRGQYQPRREFAEEPLKELADSIRAQGIIQPIIVRRVSEKRYEIIAGERRWRAAQMAGLQEVPVVIRAFSDEAALAAALIENIQREDLNPIEQANALYRLQQEFSLTHEEIAQTVGKSRAAVTNFIRLLQLDNAVKTWIESQTLSLGHAKVLLALSGQQQVEAAKMVVARHLSVRETEHLVHQLQKPVSSSKSPKKASPDIKRLETQFSDQLGAKVVIQPAKKGQGRVVIYYHSMDEFEGIFERFIS
jgi:ParB family chromosome partitioning protein